MLRRRDGSGGGFGSGRPVVVELINLHKLIDGTNSLPYVLSVVIFCDFTTDVEAVSEKDKYRESKKQFSRQLCLESVIKPAKNRDNLGRNYETINGFTFEKRN